MLRTAEQVAVDEALTAAIQAVRGAYGWREDDEVLTDYLVITSTRSWDADGQAYACVTSFVRDNEVPLHVQLGMLDYMQSVARAEIVSVD